MWEVYMYIDILCASEREREREREKQDWIYWCEELDIFVSPSDTIDCVIKQIAESKKWAFIYFIILDEFIRL